MCPKSAQNSRHYSELVHTYFSKNPFMATSLSYSLVGTSALGALGRRFESCRPDSLNPSHTSEFLRLAFFCFLLE